MQSLFDFLRLNPDSANAIATIASAITAILAFIVSLAALFVARATLKHQRQHNILSVKPLPMVSIGDYENHIEVALKNHGIGPMIVKEVAVTNGETSQSSVVEWMPLLPFGLHWTTFEMTLRDRAVLPGDGITLLELNGDPADPMFAAARDSVRMALASLEVKINYSDIYDSPLQQNRRDLKWFGRHFDPSNLQPSNQGFVSIPNAQRRRNGTQRDVMTEIFAHYRADHERVIKEYAAAESRGDVTRTRNTHGVSAVDYARALLADGLRKGWLK